MARNANTADLCGMATIRQLLETTAATIATRKKRNMNGTETRKNSSTLRSASVTFAGLSGYKPVIGGLRHLTYRPGTPSPGEIVELLCGAVYQVPRRARSPHIYDCSACAAVHRESSEVCCDR